MNQELMLGILINVVFLIMAIIAFKNLLRTIKENKIKEEDI